MAPIEKIHYMKSKTGGKKGEAEVRQLLITTVSIGISSKI
jgi:hypothetical protein